MSRPGSRARQYRKPGDVVAGRGMLFRKKMAGMIYLDDIPGSSRYVLFLAKIGYFFFKVNFGTHLTHKKGRSRYKDY